jgi:hypothetical protein
LQDHVTPLWTGAICERHLEPEKTGGLCDDDELFVADAARTAVGQKQPTVARSERFDLDVEPALVKC